MAKNIKLNDQYDKKKKAKKVKKVSMLSDEAKEIRNFVLILLGIIVIILIVYAVTTALSDDEEESTREVTAGEINYDKVTVGTMLNRDVKEYYVIIYDAEDSNAIYYSSVINKYMDTDSALTVYFCDLGNKLNEKYLVAEGESSNPSAKSIDELALGDLTLIKVKNGKITKYLEDIDTIKSELGL